MSFILLRRILPRRLSLHLLIASIALLGACASPSGPVQRDVAAPAYEALEPVRQELIFQALALLGTAYRNGGTTPQTGFDCSGLVRYLFRNVSGLNLPHSAEEIAHIGEALTDVQLRPGDLVFYNTQGKANSHVGIYVGDGRFIHAPSERGVVRIESMSLPYWTQRYGGARRVLT